MTQSTTPQPSAADLTELARSIIFHAKFLGFQHAGITDIELSDAEAHLQRWLAKGYHGEMGYMARHGTRRSRPAELVPGTLRAICVRLDYFPPNATDATTVLKNPKLAYVSRYALGRDYHKLMRKRLQKLADFISNQIGMGQYRVFVDSAPVLEKALAEKAGLGWIGKHSNLLHRENGSWFFLGEIYTDLPLPINTPASAHCGTCQACIDVCPTQAIVGPYQVDARRCISYLTIEQHGSIPEPLRPLLGNRIYGCDDCQLVCPWNRYAQLSNELDFAPRHRLDSATLIELFNWTEEEFNRHTEGSAIRRIGHEAWLRNIAVALGNGASTDHAITALHHRNTHPSAMVREHVAWALARLTVQASP